MKTILLSLLTLATSLATVDASLVAYWNLDEASGNVADSAGPVFSNSTNSITVDNYGHPSVPAGTYGVLTLTPGLADSFATATNIPVNNSYFLGSAEGSELNLIGDFSAMAWVQPTTITGRHMVLGTGAGGEDGWKFGLSNGQLAFTANGVADRFAPMGAFLATEDEWFHLAVTVAGSTGTRTVKYYVNGSEVHSATLSNIKPSTATSMLLGNNGQENPATAGGSSFGENFDGLLDEVRVYDTVLTEEQIQTVAIPEPSSWALILTGIAGVCVVLRRRSLRA